MSTQTISLIKRPAQLAVKQTIAALIYGQPGMGKTTLACSAPAPVLFDFDGGVTRMCEEHQVPTVQVDSWDTAISALGEIEKMKYEGDCPFKTIIVDTLSKMIDCIIISICGGKTPQIKDWTNVNTKFKEFLRRVQALGINAVFVAQRAVEKDGDTTRYVPDVRASNYKDIVCDMDAIGYMEMVTDKGRNMRRITFDPTPRSEGKNTANFKEHYDIAQLAKGQVSTFLADRFADYVQAQKERMAQRQATEEKQTVMVNGFMPRLEAADDAMSLNELVAWVKSQPTVGDAKMRMAAALKEKAMKLGLKYNKASNLYE